MSRFVHIHVEEEGLRVDKLLASSLEELTRSAVQNLIEEGRVTCCGRPLTKSAKLKAGEEIQIELPEVRPLEVLPEDIPLDIPYEDEDLLVVNKPKGMVVHPAPGHESGTLVNALLHHCGSSLSGINGVARPGIVHRIDKDTSGLLIVAKNDCFAQLLLGETCSYPLLGGEAFFWFYTAAAATGNGADPPDSGAHGLYRSPGGRRSCIWTQKSDHILTRAVFTRGKDWFYPSPFEGIFGTGSPASRLLYRFFIQAERGITGMNRDARIRILLL